MRQILNPIKSILLPKNYYQNKNILITGGGSGLGKQMAITYSELGANVSIIGRKEDKLKKTSLQIQDLTQNEVKYHSLDVRDNQAINDLANKLEKEKQLPNIVINNAAGNFIARSETLSNNAWNSVIDIVLKGTINMTTEFGKKMISNKKPGVFLNISTTYAETGSAFVVPSAVAKAGCNNLTKSLSAEWGKHGIRLLSVAPGPIYTDGAFSRLDPTNRFTKIAKEKLPLGRLGEKEELSNFISYLTSDHNNWMTGQVINFDGGEVIANSGEFNILHTLTDFEWKIISKLR